MPIGYSDIWVGGGVGTVLSQVLLRWMPSRLSPLVVAAVSAAAADDDDDDDGGGGGGGDDDDNDASHLRSPRGTWSMYRALDLPHSVASTCEPRPAVPRWGR